MYLFLRVVVNDLPFKRDGREYFIKNKSRNKYPLVFLRSFVFI